MRRTRPRKTSTTGMVVRVGDAVQGCWSEMAGGLFGNQCRWRALFTQVACALTTDVLAEDDKRQEGWCGFAPAFFVRCYLKRRRIIDQMLTVLLLYERLYAAFLGFVIHPAPLGAFNPRAFFTIRLPDVRAAMLFLRLGLRILNMMSRHFKLFNAYL